MATKQRTSDQPAIEQPVDPNNVQALREEQLMSKAELARSAGVSALTIDRIEKGLGCRVDTKRKIVLALGLRIDEKERVFSSLRNRNRTTE